MTCNESGNCNCKCDVVGAKCTKCELGHHGFPKCYGRQSFQNVKCEHVPSNEVHNFLLETKALKLAACNCSATGSVSSMCDDTGKCTCKTGYSGNKCSECKSGYYKDDASGECVEFGM